MEDVGDDRFLEGEDPDRAEIGSQNRHPPDLSGSLSNGSSCWDHMRPSGLGRSSFAKTSPREKRHFFSKLQLASKSSSFVSDSNTKGMGHAKSKGEEISKSSSQCSIESSESKMDSLSDAEDIGSVIPWSEEEDESLSSDGLSRADTPEPNPDNLSEQELVIQSELRKVEDLRYDTLPRFDQLEILRSLEVRLYRAGEHIVEEGDEASGFFLILGPSTAEVEVVKKSKGLVTRLKQGKCFGEKFFISRRAAKRTATITAVTDAKLGLVSPPNFSKWDNFRLFLLMRTFPLINTLPKSDQIEMYNLFQHEEFAPGEFIVRQGDIGDKFYIIVEGSADVKELDPDFEEDFSKSITQLRLYEGHSFGELALIFDEPRTASVVAVDKVSCFVLSKAAFREALSTAKNFHETMQELIYEILNRREKRAATRAAHMYSRSHERPEMKELMNLQEIEDAVYATGAFGGTKFSDVAEKSKIPGRGRGLRINTYETLCILGKGSYGCVYLVQNDQDHKMYAMKTLLRQSNKWNNLKKTNEIRAEIDIMKKLRHDNIVALHEVIDDQTSKEVYLIQELLEGGPILPNEPKTEPLPVAQARKYFRDMLKGVRYLHSKGIVHRDLKPQNMLRTDTDRVKIADFGAAVFTGTKAVEGSKEVLTAGGTPAFMAPEIYKITRNDSGEDEAKAFEIVYSPKVDVWGLGATLYNMIVGQPPWMADNELQLAETVRNMELTYPENTQFIDPGLRNLLASMLDKDPQSRISMDKVYVHDWVTSDGSEPLDDSGSSDHSTRTTTTPSRQSSGSTSSLLTMPGLNQRPLSASSNPHNWPSSLLSSRKSSHEGSKTYSYSDMSIAGDSDPNHSAYSINLQRHNSHSRKNTGASAKMHESVLIMADNGDVAGGSGSLYNDAERGKMSPGIASRRISSMYENSPLTQGAFDHAGGAPAASAGNAIAEVEENGQLGIANALGSGKKLLKSTKMTRMTSSNVVTESGELRKALKIITPIIREKSLELSPFDDYDSYESDLSDDEDDYVFETRRTSPPPCFVDPVLPSSLNPLLLRSKSNLEEQCVEIDISEEELLGSKSKDERSHRHLKVGSRHSSSFSQAETVSSLTLSPRIDLHPCAEDGKASDATPSPDSSGTSHAAGVHKLIRNSSGSGLIQRGHSASTLTGRTMSFVTRQRMLQDQQLAAAADTHKAIKRAFSKTSNASGDGEYCRTISSGEEVDEELSKYSVDMDEVKVLTDQDMDDMFDLLITPSAVPQIDLQLAPMIINGNGLRKLLLLKTWAGQSNPAFNLRYGLAESIVGRQMMEDRTTAIASIEAYHNRAMLKSDRSQLSSQSQNTKEARHRSDTETSFDTALRLSGSREATAVAQDVKMTSSAATASLLTSGNINDSFDFSDAAQPEDVGYISDASDSVGSSLRSPRSCSRIEMNPCDAPESLVRASSGEDKTLPKITIPSESDNMSTPNSCVSRGVTLNHLDFAFFGIYDGHGGCFAAETLQNNLHTSFENRLILNNLHDSRNSGPSFVPDDDLLVVKSITEAFAIVDRQILTADSVRKNEIESARKQLQQMMLEMPTTPLNKFGLREEVDESHHRSPMYKGALSGIARGAKFKLKSKESPMSTSFSGSTVVAMIVIKKSPDKSENDSNAFETPDSSSVKSKDFIISLPTQTSSTAISSDNFDPKKLNIDDAKVPPTPPSGFENFPPPPAPQAFRQYSSSSGSAAPGDFPPYIPKSEAVDDDKKMLKISSFDSIDSLKGSRVSSSASRSTAPIRVVIAHVGDCRAVLSDAGEAVVLTADHHTCMPSEKIRVEAAGGKIMSGRVNGVLAVTRSVGDIMYKQFDPNFPAPYFPLEESKDNGLWSKSQHVISKPDVVDFVVLPSHEFVILASDGLWEVFDVQQVINFTRQRLYEHGDIQRASIELIAKAENCGAVDNTSVVIVCLNQQDRSGIINTPSKRITVPRSHSLASESSASSGKDTSVKRGTWKMTKRHHSDGFSSMGNESGESFDSSDAPLELALKERVHSIDLDVTIDSNSASS